MMWGKFRGMEGERNFLGRRKTREDRVMGNEADTQRGSWFVEREGVGEGLIVRKHGMHREGKRKKIPRARNFE